MRVRRVGSITCGSTLILFGALFVLRHFVPGLSFEAIVHLWPLVLILLGIEILLANRGAKEQAFRYDLGAVALVLTAAVFSMVMGIGELCIEHAQHSFLYLGP